MTELYDKVQQTKEWLAPKIDGTPALAMILGSGLGALGDDLEDANAISYDDIPNFPTSGVEGHAGRLVFGKMSGKQVVVMQGRSHYYEGWEPWQITFPVRVFGHLGIERILITNSAGGINRDFEPGDLMLITDHINMMGFNALRGENDDRFGARFPDMSDAYNTEMRNTILLAAKKLNLPLKAGVYVGLSGPSYETPAEIRAMGTLGADAVGMSTVPETVVANHMGMKVGGISCISNLAAGIATHKLHHQEVKDTANRVRGTFGALVKKTVELLDTP